MAGSIARGSALSLVTVVVFLAVAGPAPAEARSIDVEPRGPVVGPPENPAGPWTPSPLQPPSTRTAPATPTRDPGTTVSGDDGSSAPAAGSGPRQGLCSPAEGRALPGTNAPGRDVGRRDRGPAKSVDRGRGPSDPPTSRRSADPVPGPEGTGVRPQWAAAFRNISRLVFF